MWKLTFHSGATRTLRGETYSDIIERMEWEARIRHIEYKDLGIYSIVKIG